MYHPGFVYYHTVVIKSNNCKPAGVGASKCGAAILDRGVTPLTVEMDVPCLGALVLAGLCLSGGPQAKLTRTKKTKIRQA